MVFGGAGFLGHNVVKELAAAGHEITVFDKKKPVESVKGVSYIQGNILNGTEVREAVSGIKAVYNFAGLADLNDCVDRPLQTIEINVLGNAIIAQACVDLSVKRFVYASTAYVSSQKGGFYRCSKQASETYLDEFHNRYGLEYTVLRYGTLYGPGADKRNSVYKYLFQALHDRKITCKNPDAMREYIHVRDAARLSVEILREKYANKKYVLTGHYSMHVKDMLNIVREIVGEDVEIVYQPEEDAGHYTYTPYSFTPQIGQKLISNEYTDIGEGLLECLEEIYRKENLNDKSINI